ncbi:hypothetical protein L484_009842 [Morus notabilis]|uniref:Uncharacterized protein n=1 Tax=Morus notabilis TaxID=981085 RepID=W9RA52_9ROSA|nr:hypothetical protein L484_004052 [Morus notabilis]EXC25532.1 hypothetical protein L484_009842 [Morus notabilis]
MAVFRGTVMLCCLGIILLFFISASAEEAEEESLDFPEIHTVSHTVRHGCKGGLDPKKGNQCQDNDDDDDEDLDEDVDDTYKVVDQVKVSLTSAGKATKLETLTNDDDASESDVDQFNEGVVVLGH